MDGHGRFIRSIQRDAEIGGVKDETDVQGPKRRVSTHIINVMQPKCEGLSIFLKLAFYFCNCLIISSRVY